MLTRVRATAKHVRVSPQKVRQVARLIQGMPALEAATMLEFTDKAAARPLLKCLNSAIANAENNDGLDPDQLVVDTAVADEGPTMKRYQPRAMGRAYRIRKRTTHITVIVAAESDFDAADEA